MRHLLKAFWPILVLPMQAWSIYTSPHVLPLWVIAVYVGLDTFILWAGLGIYHNLRDQERIEQRRRELAESLHELNRRED